jgi:hypothetical protein
VNPSAVLSVEPLSRRVLDGVAPAGDERRRVDVGLLLWCEDERPLRGLAGFVDWRRHGELSRMIRSGWCTGRAGESTMLPVREHLPMRRMLLHGLGPSSGLGASQAADGARRAVEVVLRLNPRDVLFALPGGVVDRERIEALFNGMLGALQSASVGVPWWVIAEERHTARLRRLLEGPPRAAES